MVSLLDSGIATPNEQALWTNSTICLVGHSQHCLYSETLWKEDLLESDRSIEFETFECALVVRSTPESCHARALTGSSWRAHHTSAVNRCCHCALGDCYLHVRQKGREMLSTCARGMHKHTHTHTHTHTNTNTHKRTSLTSMSCHVSLNPGRVPVAAPLPSPTLHAPVEERLKQHEGSHKYLQ